jgi:hypothetical protein
MSYTAKGRLSVKLPTTSGTSKAGKDWSKTSFVIEVEDGKYSKLIALDTMSDKVIAAVESARIGSEVEVKFDVQSREYQGKYYTNANCYYFDLAGGSVEQASAPTTAAPSISTPERDGLPF